jgi:glycosyltransferase involved in cell wall biosynthesis
MVLAAGAKRYFRTYLGCPLPPVAARRSGSPAQQWVYAGNLGRSYDLLTVLEALAAAPGAVLSIAGKGEGEAALRARAAQPDLAGRVNFCGYLDRAALASLLAQASVGIVPMRDDSCVGIPNKFCEYAAAGVAIVSSLGGESAALLSRTGAGATYESGRPESFLRAVQSLSPDAGSRARKMAERDFDPTRLYDRYVCEVLSLPDGGNPLGARPEAEG